MTDRSRWTRRVPASIRRPLGRVLRRWPVALRRQSSHSDAAGPVGWGDLRRLTPFSRNWGYDRGTPIDRVYIEGFMARHMSDVCGDCLEVLNADYTERFGGSRVRRSDVLDIDPANLRATIVADLAEPGSLPPDHFDCIVFTQTLHLIPDMPVALANVWQSLRRRGVLLMTVPALGRHDTTPGFHHDRWRVTQSGLEWLLGALPGARHETVTFGNVLSCTAFLYGLAAEELRPDELAHTDAQFPLIVAARVTREVEP